MAIPLYIFLIIYFVFLAVFAIFSYFDIDHIIKFGTLNFTNLLAVAIYVGGSMLILLISWQYIGQIDWKQPIELSGLINSGMPY
jgi:hypothetical protein